MAACEADTEHAILTRTSRRRNRWFQKTVPTMMSPVPCGPPSKVPFLVHITNIPDSPFIPTGHGHLCPYFLFLPGPKQLEPDLHQRKPDSPSLQILETSDWPVHFPASGSGRVSTCAIANQPHLAFASRTNTFANGLRHSESKSLPGCRFTSPEPKVTSDVRSTIGAQSSSEGYMDCSLSHP